MTRVHAAQAKALPALAVLMAHMVVHVARHAYICPTLRGELGAELVFEAGDDAGM
jgi:hypothetical protein